MNKELNAHYENMQNAINSKKVTKEILAYDLDKISFFQHERLIHLIVTCLFAIVTITALIFSFIVEEPLVLLLFFALLALLVPYIIHYYYLENGVQKLYKQYDELVAINSKLLKK